MSLARAVTLVAIVAYLLAWAIALHGASSWIAPLLLPLILAVLVAVGVALNRFLGTSPRSPRFRDPKDDSSR